MLLPAFLLALWSNFGFAQDPATTPPSPPPSAPVTYSLQASSSLYVQVWKDPTTVASDLSHDHVIRSTQHKGTIVWDPANPAACKFNITVPVAGLDVDPPDLRKAVGLEGELDTSQRGDVKKNMLSSDQLDGSKYANITFESTGCSGSGTSITVNGKMTIHGVSKAVSTTLSLGTDGKTLKAKGKLPIKATDYGFDPFSALLGALKNKNDMTIHVALEGKAG